MTEVTNWGFHLALDISGCDAGKVGQYETIYNFTKELVTRIDMVAYGEPHIVRFGSGNKFGYTMVQLIETSNICAHYVEENDTFYLDVFSCKPFEIYAVEFCVKLYFGENCSMKKHYFERNAL